MAKIYVSALLNRIAGRLGDAVYATKRGTAYVRTMSTTFTDPATPDQLRVRQNLSSLASAYGNLSDAEKDLWREWANLKGRKGGARASYISVNCNLLNASHSDLVAISSPAKTPGTPKFPKHFCVTVLSPTQVCLQWTEPVDTDTYVTGHYRLDSWFCGNHPCFGLCPTTGYSWGRRFLQTVRGDAAAIQHVHSWPLSTKLYYWLNSIDKCGRKSPVTHTIKVTTTWSPFLFVADSGNYRIVKRRRGNLGFVAKIGSQGSGNDQFEGPLGICGDTAHIYVSDSGNNRIVKRRRDNFAFVAKVGSLGAGDDQFNSPASVNCDDTYLYISDMLNHRIVKRRKDDLSFVTKIGTQGAGDDQFDHPSGVECDDTHIYVTDSNNHRIMKRKRSDLSFVAKIGTQGAGDNQFDTPRGIEVDGTHVFVIDSVNNRVQKRLKSDLSFVAKVGTYGTGQDQFARPRGIECDDTHIYVTDTEGAGGVNPNHRINKRLKSDLSFVQMLGGLGSGDNQFSTPSGIAIQNRFS